MRVINCLEPAVTQSMKHAQFKGFHQDLYQSFNPTPSPVPSNTKGSNFGLANPLFKKFHETTSHNATFTGPPETFEKVTIDPNVKKKLSDASWQIGSPSTKPVINTVAKLSYQSKGDVVVNASKESQKNI